MLDPYSEAIWWLCYAVGALCLHGFGPLVPLQGRVPANKYKVVLSYHLCLMMKHFHPDGSGLFQDGNVPIYMAGGVTELFDENDMNHAMAFTVTSSQHS